MTLTQLRAKHEDPKYVTPVLVVPHYDRHEPRVYVLLRVNRTTHGSPCGHGDPRYTLLHYYRLNGKWGCRTFINELGHGLCLRVLNEELGALPTYELLISEDPEEEGADAPP